jgi:hypothetical protein
MKKIVILLEDSESTDVMIIKNYFSKFLSSDSNLEFVFCSFKDYENYLDYDLFYVHHARYFSSENHLIVHLNDLGKKFIVSTLYDCPNCPNSFYFENHRGMILKIVEFAQTKNQSSESF